jgi:hypothetical protein
MGYVGGSTSSTLTVAFENTTLWPLGAAEFYFNGFYRYQ